MPVQRTPASAPELPAQPARNGVGPAPAAARQPASTRTSAAWLGLGVGILLLIALAIFMLQNTAPVEVTFLGMSGNAPLAVVLLIAGLAVGFVALVVGGLRIGQLRRRVRAERRRADATPTL